MSCSQPARKDFQQAELLEQLRIIFPDADSVYLAYCLTHYRENAVERVTEKIYQTNYGQYPQVGQDCNGDPSSIAAFNYYLTVLSELFPDVCVLFLQDKIRRCKRKSHEGILYTLISYLRKLDSYPRRQNYGVLHRWDMFRDPQYIKGARLRLCNEFPDLWKSSIRAYMAENHNDLLLTYEKLEQLAVTTAQSPRPRFINTILALPIFQRKPCDEPEMQHPQLLAEMEEIHHRGLAKQYTADLLYAEQINEQEYETTMQLITCTCCYDDVTFENLITCAEGHMFCRSCLQRYVKEGLFGQGHLRGKTIPCISGGPETCDALFNDSMLASALDSKTYSTYSFLLSEAEIKATGLNVLTCPFCGYAEATETLDDRGLSAKMYTMITTSWAYNKMIGWILYASQTKLTVRGLMMGFAVSELVFQGMTPSSFMHPLALFIRLMMTTAIVLVLFWNHKQQPKFWYDYGAVRSKLTPTFICRRPSCGKRSCLECLREFRPLHSCTFDGDKITDSLRLYVERAMSEAVKRVCPECSLSFTKSDGCNLVTCTRCGYIMCYLCRKDIKKEKYEHFCRHFRMEAGAKCRECTNCDLYKVDEEAYTRKIAGTKARDDWLALHSNVIPDKQVAREIDALFAL